MAEKDVLSVGLTVGGQTIEKVVKKIRFDIQELQSAVAQQKGVEFSDEFIDGIINRVKDALAVKRIYAQEKEFQETVKTTQTQMFMLRSEMDDRVRVLERGLREEFTEQVQRMRSDYDQQLQSLRAEVAALQEGQRVHTDTLAAHHKRADKAEVRVEEVRDESLRRLRHQHLELLSVMEAKVNDTFSLVDGRVSKVEGDLYEVVNRHTEALAVFDIRIDNTTNKLQAIEDDYASHTDMLLKADIVSLQSKASLIELEKVIMDAEATQRQLNAFAASTTQSHKRLEADLTARGDAKAQWILRTLRKELAKHDEGTDIGKVKCLVCDQPVAQKKEADSRGFGAPLQPVLQPQGRTRDAFDDGGGGGAPETTKRDDSPGRHGAGAAKSSSQRPRSAGPVSYEQNPPRVRPLSGSSETQYQYNRRLVSLGASPSNNLLTAILAQQQQRLGDVFEDENSQASFKGTQRYAEAQVPRRVDFPPARSSTPVVAGTSNAGQGQGGQSKDYFASLENKFLHTGSAGRRPVTFVDNAVPGGMSQPNPLLQRPLSAPAHKTRRK